MDSNTPTQSSLKLIIDNRESLLIQKLSILTHIETFQLILGDIIIGYSIDKPLIIIERKTFTDIFASLKDGRYNEQSLRLKHSSNIHLHNIIYLLEGNISILSTEKRKLLYSCITSIQLFKGFSVLLSSNIDETVNILLNMINKINNNFKKNNFLYYNNDNITSNNTSIDESYLSIGIKKNKSDNIVPENIGSIILSQIPNINHSTSQVIMQPYNNFKSFYLALIESNGDILNGLKNEKGRKINKNAIENIKKYLL